MAPSLSACDSVGHFASCSAWCPGNHQSAGKRKTGKTRKGNPVIRYWLGEAANAARRTNRAFRSVYQSLVPRKG
ncbi:MAG: transposase, partial [Methylocella sp.]